jgi:hypothetical protein
MNELMLSCKKATELIDKKTVFKLSVKEKAMLCLHTSMCDACSAYQKQSNKIDSLLKKHLHGPLNADESPIESKELKEKIISKL